MRRIVRPLILCLLLATTSCATPGNNSSSNIESTERQAVSEESQTEATEAYEQPAWNSENKYSDYSPERFERYFPVTFIDGLSQSVYESRAETFIREINDKTLLTTIGQFNLDQDERLEEVLNNKHLDKVYYQADIDGDGVNELFIITKGGSNSDNHIIMLTLQEDIYVYAGSCSRGLFDWIDGVSDYAVIQDNNYLYVAACFRDETSGNNGICVAAINSDSFYKDWDPVRKIYIQPQIDIYECVQVYRDENSQLISGIEVYLENNLNEIFYNSRWWGSHVYGDDDLAETSWPLEITQNDLGDSGRTLFKVFDGKTIVFSLYEQKELKNGYIIDARICEDDNTTVLLEYRIRLEVSGVGLSESISFGKMDLLEDETVYQNLDYAQAFPQDKLDMESNIVDYSEQEDVIEQIDEIPAYLAERVVEVLSNNNADNYDFSGYDEQMDKNIFFDQYAPELADKPDDSVHYQYYRYDDYVYKYRMNNTSYYLLTHLYYLEGDDGYYSRWITIYEESDGEMILFNSVEFHSDKLRVFLYDNDIYVITENIRDNPGNTGSIDIYKLQSEGEGNYASVDIDINNYRWEKIYGNGESSETTINEYLEEIKRGQLTKENLDIFSYRTFHGDETKVTDLNRLSRIYAVEFYYTNAYKIDFNNDGEAECILYSYGDSTYGGVYDIAYKFSNGGLVKIAAGWTEPNGRVVQLWFKELDDKIYTFQLILCDNNYYILNVSLIEDSNITQVQNYLILPEVKYELSKV